MGLFYFTACRILIGTLTGTIGFPWLPEIINNLFSCLGAEIVFKVVFAVTGLWQLVANRTGKTKEYEAVTIRYANTQAIQQAICFDHLDRLHKESF